MSLSPPASPFAVEDNVSLAGFTTLELGGPARHLVVASDEGTVIAAIGWAQQRGLPVLVLGGGSNVVIGDAGFSGLVLHMALSGLRFERQGAVGLMHAAAGEPWDQVVDAAVARGWAGIECLAGIPGLVGATPIQNVGAYGQEVSQTIVRVRALDRATSQIVDLPPTACGFGYRDSAFKRDPDAHVILGVTFALVPDGAPTVRYPELASYLAATAVADGGVGETAAETTKPWPSLTSVAAAVRVLRRRKSMLWDFTDANRRSVGSFFTNPVLTVDQAETVIARLIAKGLAAEPASVPRFATADGRVKLSAGWLIEQAGFAKGMRRGPVGLSSRHALALVHHGGGTSDQLLRLAREIRDGVLAATGVELVPEPTLVDPQGVRRAL